MNNTVICISDLVLSSPISLQALSSPISPQALSSPISPQALSSLISPCALSSTTVFPSLPDPQLQGLCHDIISFVFFRF